MNEDKELRKLPDGMPICKHRVPLDSDCEECQKEYKENSRYTRVDDIFKSTLYTGSHLKYEIKHKLSIADGKIK